jgi:hypothetical protein
MVMYDSLTLWLFKFDSLTLLLYFGCLVTYVVFCCWKYCWVMRLMTYVVFCCWKYCCLSVLVTGLLCMCLGL